MTNDLPAVTWDGEEFRRLSHLFAVSASGRVLDLRKLALATIRLRPDGYLWVGRRPHGGLVHRMVASCWRDRPAGARHVHHINGNKADNRAENLEWVTPKQHFTERHDLSANGRYRRSPETRDRLRAARLGKATSEATKQKQREASLRLGCRPPSFLGSRHADDVRERMSQNSPRNRRCEVKGVVYPSFKAAALALGERPLSLRKRCLSPNFADYRVLDE